MREEQLDEDYEPSSVQAPVDHGTTKGTRVTRRMTLRVTPQRKISY